MLHTTPKAVRAFSGENDIIETENFSERLRDEYHIGNHIIEAKSEAERSYALALLMTEYENRLAMVNLLLTKERQRADDLESPIGKRAEFVKLLCQELAYDHDYRHVWVTNISMAFQDAIDRHPKVNVDAATAKLLGDTAACAFLDTLTLQSSESDLK